MFNVPATNYRRHHPDPIEPEPPKPAPLEEHPEIVVKEAEENEPSQPAIAEPIKEEKLYSKKKKSKQYPLDDRTIKKGQERFDIFLRTPKKEDKLCGNVNISSPMMGSDAKFPHLSHDEPEEEPILSTAQHYHFNYRPY